MPRILVSNNSEILRHLSAVPFRQLALDVTVAADGEEALALLRERPAERTVDLAVDLAVDPATDMTVDLQSDRAAARTVARAVARAVDLAILDADMPKRSGYDVAQILADEAADPKTGAKAEAGTGAKAKVVLVMDKPISSEEMLRLSESGCDEVLITPMSADELYDVMAIQLGLHRHGDMPYSVTIAHDPANGWRTLEATVSNLSVDGVRLLCHEPIKENAELRVTLRFEAIDPPTLELNARALWVQAQDGETMVGASFIAVDDATRARLSEITQWQFIDRTRTERARIVIKGDLTEAVNLDKLLPRVVGRISFDMSQVRYMNSLGVREWVRFLHRANAQGYEFHACSPAFVMQASMVSGVLGRGTVVSFFAPYACVECDHQEEMLLQSSAVLAANYEAPTFPCSECDKHMELDDAPERYFAFLMPKMTGA